MIRLMKKSDEKEALAFALPFADDAVFYAPLLQSQWQYEEHLFKPLSFTNGLRVYGVYENERLIGLFSFLVSPNERYLEMLFGLSREARAYAQMLQYLKAEFPAYSADFVFSPKNYLMDEALRPYSATRYPEQVRFVSDECSESGKSVAVVPFTEEYREQYLALHDDEGRYWTGEKVLSAPSFRVFLALDGKTVAGYAECARGVYEDEIYDVFVREDKRRVGLGSALVSALVRSAEGNRVTALADADNFAVLKLFRGAGFCEEHRGASVTANVIL